MDAYLHGEVSIKKINKLPNDAMKLNAENKRYVIADSETTGNHHCVKEAEGIELYEKDGVLYLKNDVAAEVFCVDATRHDTEMVPPGIWEIQRANEYDYLNEMTRKVAD